MSLEKFRLTWENSIFTLNRADSNQKYYNSCATAFDSPFRSILGEHYLNYFLTRSNYQQKSRDMSDDDSVDSKTDCLKNR